MSQHTPGPWVRFNHLTAMYETRDGTAVEAGLADNMECLNDVIFIAIVRDKQRAAMLKAREGA
jgi:hypothetical protein